MSNTQALTLPSSSPQASLAFRLPAAVRATRVGGHRGIGQALRGAFRPAFLQPVGDSPSPASPGITAAAAASAAQESSPVSIRWWQSLLQRLGILDFGTASAPARPFQEQPNDDYAAATDFAASEIFPLSTAPSADPAASFWDENRLSAGESVQVYAPAETGLANAERPRIGRSFLGAYRKGRRAAEAGLQAKNCPYQAKQETNGRPVNGLTRTFQRYWTEGLHDASAAKPERYV